MPVQMPENSEKIPHNCLIKLQAIYDSLKTAEKKAANFLLVSPEFFANASIVEAAEKAGCSETTLFRLARKLGYQGFPELKADLVEGKSDDLFQLYTNITENDEPRNIVAKVFQASIQALNDTLTILDLHEYQKAVVALSNANKIVFCGVGDAATVAQSGYQKFIRIGIDVQFSADLDVQLINVSHLNKGDAVLVVSHTGRTKSILEVVKYARVCGVTVISITNYPMSPLAKKSDHLLLTAAFTEHMKGEIISKRVAELCIIESLFINLLLLRKDKLVRNLDRSNRALEINKL